MGIEVARSKKGFCLNQRKYALELKAETGMSGAKVFDTPMAENLRPTTNAYDATFNLQNSDDAPLPDASNI